MIKIIIYTFLISFSILQTQNKSFGFFDNNFDSNFYSNIYDNIDELEKSYTEKIIIEWVSPNKTSQNSISKNLEKRLKEKKIIKDCNLKDLSIDDVYLVVYSWELTSIYNALSDCENPVNTNTLEKTIKELKSLYYESKLIWENKVDNIQKIWKIWLYSDWILKNAPFDLIDDILQIEKIIFEEKYEEYKWVNNFDLWWAVKAHKSINTYWTPLNFTKFKYDDFNSNTIWENFNNSNTILEDENKTENKVEKINIIDWNNQICPVNNSWLDDQIIDSLINNPLINWNQQNNNSDSNSDNNWKDNNTDSWSQINTNTWIINNNSNYKQVNDNNIWPCNSFFCIIIDFVIYNHNLLWWSWKNKSIEWIIKESNEHIKKFANTSLVQSKMTTNLMENVFKDLDLPSMFHVWIVVSKKPVPMLNLDKSEKLYDSRNDFWSKNLLERYFKAYWLDYKRQNDLAKIEQLESQLKSILDSSELNTNETVKKNQLFLEEIKKNKEEIDFVDLAIQNHIITEDMAKFDEQFKEISKFVKELQEYTATINAIYKKMIEIPISWK